MGDIDEDGTDTKISCTEMLLVKKMTLEEFVVESLNYIKRYPLRKSNNHIKNQEASSTDGFVIVRGNHPIASGGIGAVLGLAREEEKSIKVIEVAAVVVDGIHVKANTRYTLLEGLLIEEQEAKR
jgi:hypothetical protein